jgi:hypothetical protein
MRYRVTFQYVYTMSNGHIRSLIYHLKHLPFVLGTLKILSAREKRERREREGGREGGRERERKREREGKEREIEKFRERNQIAS